MVHWKYFLNFNFRRADGDHCAGHDLWSVQVMISDHITDDNDDDNNDDDDNDGRTLVTARVSCPRWPLSPSL